MRYAAGRVIHFIGWQFSNFAMHWLDDGVRVPPTKLSQWFFYKGGSLEELGDRLSFPEDRISQ